jgi:hypothetical protein
MLRTTQKNCLYRMFSCLQFDKVVYDLAKGGTKLWLDPNKTSFGTYQKVLDGQHTASGGSRGKKRKAADGGNADNGEIASAVHESQSPIQVPKSIKVCLLAFYCAYRVNK